MILDFLEEPVKKIYKLKSWYSLSDAAKRLTLTLGEDVTPNEFSNWLWTGTLSYIGIRATLMLKKSIFRNAKCGYQSLAY